MRDLKYRGLLYETVYHTKNTQKKAQKGTKRHKKAQKGGIKSNYDDYDYLEGSYKRLIEQSRPFPTMGDYYNSFKDQHLYLYGYDDFVGANKLIPIKNNIGLVKKHPNMSTYYYMSELVNRNNIITENYWGHSMTNGTFARGGEPGFRNIGIRGYIKNNTTHKDAEGVPPYPKTTGSGYSAVADLSSISSIPYIDKFLYFPKQNYRFIIIKPTRESNVYDTEIGKIELNDPENGEEWFDKEVCVVFDEFFIPPPLGTIDEPEYNTSGIGAEMLRQND